VIDLNRPDWQSREILRSSEVQVRTLWNLLFWVYRQLGISKTSFQIPVLSGFWRFLVVSRIFESSKFRNRET